MTNLVSELKNTVRDYRISIQAAQDKCDDFAAKYSQIYQPDAFAKGMSELTAKRDAAIADGNAAVKQLVDGWIASIADIDTLKGAEMTDDVKLIESPVKLTQEDLAAMFDRAKAEEMCRVLGLEVGSRIKTLSKGTREKMQLMLVMSRRARLYLLDEPIAGVDPAAREFILRTILTNYNENGTVLISTHLILDVEQVLDEAVFLQQGQVVLHESTDSIRERTGGSVDELFRNMFRAPVMGNGGEYNAR